MSRLTTNVAAAIAAGVSDVLEQAGAVLTGGQGDYLKNGQPESVYGQIQQATARQACRRYADDPAAVGERLKVAYENVCRPYLDDIGYGSSGSVKVPFVGGQCNTIYRVEGTFTPTCGGTETRWNTQNMPGPILGIVPESDGVGWRVNSGADSIRYLALFWNTSNAIFDIDRLAGGNCGAVSSGVRPRAAVSPVITNIIRIDGLPDDCGTLPPDVVDPIPPPAPGPGRERYNPGPSIDIEIGVDINPDGTIDVDFGTGPINIDPFGDRADPGDGGPGPGDVGEPGSPETADGSGDAEGEAPEGSVVVGLRLELTSAPDNARQFSPGIYRGGAYIYMGTSEGLDQDYAGSMLSDGQFVFAEKENLTHWRVRANVGYNWLVIPFYRQVE